MWKIAVLIFAIVGTTLAGIAVTIVLATPSLADQGMKLVPIAALVGFILGIPASLLVARMIDRARRLA